MLFGSWQRSHCYSGVTFVNVVTLVDHIRELAVTLDKHLTLDQHVSSVLPSRPKFRTPHQVRRSLTTGIANTIACSLVTTRLHQLAALRCQSTAQNTKCCYIDCQLSFVSTLISFKIVNSVSTIFLHQFTLHLGYPLVLCVLDQPI